MPSATAVDADPSHVSETPISTREIDTQSDHTLPPSTIAENAKQVTSENEDPATVAASEELRQTSISDKDISTPSHGDGNTKIDEEIPKPDLATRKNEESTTPEPAISAAQDEDMRERISSPKKKRGRDLDDDGVEVESGSLEGGASALDGAIINGNRSKGLEPQKKRVRDGSEDRSSDAAEVDISDTKPPTNTKSAENESQSRDTTTNVPGEKPQTSASAFASSGFASLSASTTSGFGSIGSSKPSIFGGGPTAAPPSGFAALTPKSPNLNSPGKASGFGGLVNNKPTSGFGFGGGVSSGFGGLSSGSAFGSGLGNGFSSGGKLSSFAAPGAATTSSSSKPAKAFGAPESDEEDASDDENSDGPVGSDDEEKPNLSPEEKKKSKFQKVHIEDGEAGEATLLSVRAKLFVLPSIEVGWKERGVGQLKINVPQSCVTYDEGHPVPGSFDASGLEDLDDESVGSFVPRLVMRQDSTHRVILNTALLKGLLFQQQKSTTAAVIGFTAIEGDVTPKPVNMQLKMNEANAKLFLDEVKSIQREL